MDQKRNNLLTYAIIAGLLIFTAVATVALPAISDQLDLGLGSGGPPSAPEIEESSEPVFVTIDIQDYFLGEQLMAIPFLADLNGTEVRLSVLLGILTVVFVALTLPVGAVLFFIYTRLDETTVQTKQSETFKTAVSTIEEKQKSFVNEMKKEQPPDEKPDHVLPRWSVLGTTLIIVFFGLMLGALLGEALIPSGEIAIGGGGGEPATILNPAAVFGWGTALLALIVTLFTIRPQRLLAVDESDYGTVNWGVIWVILSGVVLVGLGMGAILAVQSGGGG